MTTEDTGAAAPEEQASAGPEVETHIPAGQEAAATPEAQETEQQPEAVEEQPQARVKANPFQSRIDELTKIRREQERENAALKEQLAKYQSATEAQPQEQQPQSAEDFEAIVNRRAAEVALQREMQKRTDAWLQAGMAEFKDDFNDRCNVVASLGASDRPEFMHIVTDPDIIPDGHRLVAALADDPQEAARILALPPVQMSAALVRYAGKLSAPKAKPISSAPAPIKPLDGSAPTNDEPTDRDSEDDWFAKRQKQIEARYNENRRLGRPGL